MAKVQIPVTVSKETYELVKGLSDFIKATKLSLEDGFQIGDDIPDLIKATMTSLIPAMQGVMKISDEAKNDPHAFYSALSTMIPELVEIFVDKK